MISYRWSGEFNLRVPRKMQSQGAAPLQAVVKGDPKSNERAQIGAGHKRREALRAEEQVECLLDQATDASILGRTWAGWRPFV